MAPTPDWLQERLFERRLVLVTGRLDEALASRAAAQIIMLDGAGDEPIDVILDSADGTLEAAFALIAVIDVTHAPLRLRCQGQVAGPAIGVAAAANHRAASEHASFRLSAPTLRFSGTPDQVAEQSRQHRLLLWRFQARLAKATGRPAEDIAEVMRRGRYLDAREALEYGLIEAIAT